MDSANNYPQICLEVGLTCESCTSSSAREVAAICKGLRGKAIDQLFVQIYPDPACARMHAHFAAAYREATEQPKTAPERLPAKRAVPFARPRTMYAVA